MRSAVRRFLLRLRNAIAPGRAERELSREVASHLAMLEAQYRRTGMSDTDARLAARRAIGGLELAKDLQRDARSFVWIDDLRRDAAYAVRTMLRAPIFTAVAILTLALAIGANTAILSVVDHVLWRSLPLPHADRLVRLYESNPAAGRPKVDASSAHAADWRIALGASRMQVVRLVVGASVGAMAIGVTLGLAGAAAAARSLGTLVFGVPPIDPVTLVLMPAAFIVIAALASLAPARRATQIDPVVALRND
jgi:hypothetical protein